MTQNRNLTALILSVPITSIGAAMSLWIAPGIIGQAILIVGQIWLLCLPIFWLLKIEHQAVKISQPKQFDYITGIIIGLLMFAAIIFVYWFLLRHWIDVNVVRERLDRVVQLDRTSFILAGIYFTIINALIEEYFWRWFVYSRCKELVSDSVAVWLTALFFTLHHTIGLAFFTDWRTTLVSSLAVFIAGVIWSDYYRRYGSIWSNYISHAIADLALHLVAWQVFFG